ncbi:hypothetical protein B0H63DRAFT_493359 [Podospora didyma]|uniref:RBR-type E3 ubiquitin transferase n=1 Tax=Podospora didyma TaxID=330526 RepID=A0AAE0U112_9PEZI|nr:hypothetical protein B0H63DRAFT_493359 [Podospora didyma]
MASSSTLSKPFYGSVSPAILGSFDWDDDIKPPEQEVSQKQPNNATSTTSNSPSTTMFRYKMNPAILGDDFTSGPSTSSSTIPTRKRSHSRNRNRLRVVNVSPVRNPPARTPRRPPAPQYRGYLPISPSILADFEDEGWLTVGDGPPALQDNGKGKAPAPVSSVMAAVEAQIASSLLTTRSSSAYFGLSKSRHNPAATADTETEESSTSAKHPGSFAPEDIGFGQRYQVDEGTDLVVITNKRQLPEIQAGTQQCSVCFDEKEISEFPRAAVTRTCKHPPRTCLECMKGTIRAQLESKLWNEIGCPEEGCKGILQNDDIQRFADEETNDRYQALSFRGAMSESDNFVWCTSGCGYGQVHEGGLSQPIVICLKCNHRSCFHHRVAWHENLTCDEYDALQADPLNFRSRFELENELAEQEAAARRAQEEADREFAKTLLEEEQRAIDQEIMEREERAQKERQERERQEREVREIKARKEREAAAKRQAEDLASATKVKSTTKPCPGCKAPIEKNSGW